MGVKIFSCPMDEKKIGFKECKKNLAVKWV